MSDDADRQLGVWVNNLGLAIFTLLVVYHYITASPADASA